MVTICAADDENTLALNSHMDFIQLATLLREDPDDCSCSKNKHKEARPPKQTTLSLHRLELDFNVSAEIVDKLHRWRQYDLVNCTGEHVDALLSALFQHPNIDRVSLCSQPVDPVVVKALGEGLRKPHSIRELSLKIDVSPETARLLCRGINQGSVLLQNLDLSQCDFAAEAIPVLCQELSENQHLHSLKLINCRLEDEEAAEIVHALTYHPTLKELSLRMNYCDSIAYEAIATFLESNMSLERLDIAQQNPGVIDLAILSGSLELNTTLKSLDVCESYLKDTGMAAMANALTVNETLEDLFLESCDIGDVGFGALMRNIPKMNGTHRHRLRFWMKENKFQANHDLVIKATTLNHRLHVLDMQADQTNSDIQYQLALNRYGRGFLSNSHISVGHWPAILARLFESFEADETVQFSVHDIAFHLLHGPALLER